MRILFLVGLGAIMGCSGVSFPTGSFTLTITPTSINCPSSGQATVVANLVITENDGDYGVSFVNTPCDVTYVTSTQLNFNVPTSTSVLQGCTYSVAEVFSLTNSHGTITGTVTDVDTPTDASCNSCSNQFSVTATR